jgi:hypothetical protein
MKRCPTCQRTYTDDTLSYCLEDGSTLFSNTAASDNLAATLIIPEPRVTAPVQPDTYRSAPAQPQPFTQPPPTSWPPLAGAQALQAAPPARQGRGAAVTSLVLAIAAFLLLGFCIIAGASGVEESLIGGIFIFSLLLALPGAVLGIIATSRSSKDTSAQNAKAMSIVALVLNGLYLLIAVIFLILGAVANSNSR